MKLTRENTANVGAIIRADGSIDFETLAETAVTAYDTETTKSNAAPILMGLAVLWLIAG